MAADPPEPDSADFSRLPVAVLGATGAVGQRFVALLADHPWFEVVEVLASARSAGKRYADAVDWLVPAELPAAAAALEVGRLGAAVSSPVCFSALDAAVAREAELELARAGKLVISNASSWRMEPTVPLVVPEVNADHLALLDAQTEHPGGIITNPNCSTIGLVLALRPLLDAFGLVRVQVVTMQAISGAGAPTAATLDLLGNVVPYIRGEEEKLESEPLKILGELEGSVAAGDLAIAPAELRVEAQCNRVPVLDGHTLCVRVELEEDATAEELCRAWREFSGPPQELELPSAPDPLIRVHDELDAPQPRQHAELLGGMGIHVGRLRERSPREWQFTTLSHNTVRGAAGGAILVGELALATGWMRFAPLSR